MDRLDFQIVELFSRRPESSVLSASRDLGVARPTVQARLNRLRERGILVDILPKLQPSEMGYPVQAMVMLQIDQRIGHGGLHDRLLAIPEVIDCSTMAGPWDMLLRVVAHSNTDLQRVIDRIGSLDAVGRTSTSIVLRDLARDRVLPLMDDATRDGKTLE